VVLLRCFGVCLVDSPLSHERLMYAKVFYLKQLTRLFVCFIDMFPPFRLVPHACSSRLLQPYLLPCAQTRNRPQVQNSKTSGNPSGEKNTRSDKPQPEIGPTIPPGQPSAIRAYARSTHPRHPASPRLRLTAATATGLQPHCATTLHFRTSKMPVLDAFFFKQKNFLPVMG
jgi:hypothetical protein